MNAYLPVEILSSNFVWSWYEKQRSALLTFFDTLRNQAFSQNASGVGEFSYLTLQNLEVRKNKYCDELDKIATLFIVATAEANIRFDFNYRIAQKLKDPTSKKFRKVRQERPDRISLENEILDIWSDYKNGTDSKNIVGHFRGLLKYRHWLAHGRCWRQQIGQHFTPDTAMDISENLFTALPIKSNWHMQEDFEVETR